MSAWIFTAGPREFVEGVGVYGAMRGSADTRTNSVSERPFPIGHRGQVRGHLPEEGGEYGSGRPPAVEVLERKSIALWTAVSQPELASNGTIDRPLTERRRTETLPPPEIEQCHSGYTVKYG